MIPECSDNHKSLPLDSILSLFISVYSAFQEDPFNIISILKTSECETVDHPRNYITVLEYFSGKIWIVWLLFLQFLQLPQCMARVKESNFLLYSTRERYGYEAFTLFANWSY
jgi:hypothetical protein